MFSKLELDINRMNTLRADVFYMQGKKERERERWENNC